jgi:hypothetical protein
MAAENTRHDQALASLRMERDPVAAQFAETDSRRRQKQEAAERFDRALEEMAQSEKQLEARNRTFMDIVNLDAATRAESRVVSDALRRIPGERKLVLADKATAAQEAAALEPEVSRLHAELQRIDAAIAAEEAQFSEAARRITTQVRQIERERKESDIHMSRLDRKKHGPYRVIGACLADQNIAPLNQPEMLEKVLVLRARETALRETIAALRSACAATSAAALATFYILLAALLIALAILALRIA